MLRDKAWAPAILICALGLFLAFIACDGLAPLLSVGRTNPDRLTIWIGSAMALPAACASLCVAAAMLARGQRTQRRLMVIFLICLPLLIVLPAALWIGSAMMLPARGYVRCEQRQPGFRVAPAIWARRNATCDAKAIDPE